MEGDDIRSNQEAINKLRKKAELCRFAHSELKSKYVNLRNWKEFSIVLTSVLLVVLINLYYRKTLVDEWVLISIWVLPLLTTIIQALDYTIFQWTRRVAKHDSAVAIWGDWIREADFLEKRLHQYESTMVEEKCKTYKKNIAIVWATQSKYQTANS